MVEGYLILEYFLTENFKYSVAVRGILKLHGYIFIFNPSSPLMFVVVVCVVQFLEFFDSIRRLGNAWFLDVPNNKTFL